MKTWIAALALVAVEASAHAPVQYEAAIDPWEAALVRQCPAKRLDLLAPADLRGALDLYKERQTVGVRMTMNQREAEECRDVPAGTSCANLADLAVAGELRQTTELAAKVCGTFQGCRAQSDCSFAF